MALLNTDNPYAVRILMDDIVYTFDTFEENSTTKSENIAQPAYFNFIGKNKKAILYLVESEKDDYFSPAAYDAFNKTILALGLTMDDIAVFNLSGISTETSFEILTAFFNPSKVILAGSNPERIGMPHLSLNTSIHLDQVKILYTYSFEEMLNDIDKKKLFWQSVKAL